MAALIASIKGRVLIQVADMEPVEVGTIEIPIHVGTQPENKKRGIEISTAHVQVERDVRDIAANLDETLRGRPTNIIADA